MRTATEKIANRKAPGPDALAPEIVKIFVKNNGEMVKRIMNDCLKEGNFPTDWKKAKLVLLPKPKKPTQLNEETKYRPVCLLNVLGKILENIINRRLNEELDDHGAISVNQFGIWI